MAKAAQSQTIDVVGQIVSAMPLRAPGFIVTLYGDAVVPRGGAVWMSTIIELCALVGISETLARTAVSRLVAAGQLVGVRRGRRSYYQLTDAAQAEFSEAARVIFGPQETVGWRFIFVPEGSADTRMAQLERQGFARLRPHLAVGPARGAVPDGVLAIEGAASGDLALLPEFASVTWDLAPHAQAYADLIALFSPYLVHAEALAPSDALAIRLLLVHAWRAALQRDPRLPADALPADWPGHRARQMFAQLYRALSPMAETCLVAGFDGVAGPRSETTEALAGRLAALGFAASGDVAR